MPHARRLLSRAAVSRLLSSPRHGPAADVVTVATTVASFSTLVAELGDAIEAVEINPVICSASRAVAVDVHLELRLR
jgi:acetyl-CoA synthetase